MIKNPHLLFVRDDAYTALVGGNSGGDELAISCSPSMDGGIRCVFTALSANGGVRFIEPHQTHKVEGPWARVRIVFVDRIDMALRSALWLWVGPTDEAGDERESAIEAIVASILQTWGVHTPTVEG